MACHLIQSFFREDDFTFYSSSEFTEQNPESRGESQVGFRKEPTDQTSGQSLRRALGAKQQIKQESFRFAITASRVILKTWNSTILVPSAASLLLPERRLPAEVPRTMTHPLDCAYSPETGEIRGLGQMCPLVPV